MNGREGSPSLEVSRRGGSLVVTASGTWSLRLPPPGRRGWKKPATVFLPRCLPRRAVFRFRSSSCGRRIWRPGTLPCWRCLPNFPDVRNRQVWKPDYTSLPEGMAALLDLAGAKRKRRQGTPTGGKKNAAEAESLLELIGGKTLAVPGVALSALNFIGEVSASFARLCMGRAAVNARDVWRIFRQCGVDALAIVSLTSLLLGLILAFVSALQLRAFGAEIYVSALVSVSMVRVMGPVLTGIVLAGRTGASFAAIIGSMQANEEVDALVTFGLDPVDFLVLPRVLGLALMTPLLTVYADVMGILGGFLVGTLMMDISPSAYWENTLANMSLSQIWIGCCTRWCSASSYPSPAAIRA